MEDKKKKKPKKKITFERVSTVFRHPIRAQIVHRLNKSPTTIKGLSNTFGIKRQKVNYHVKALQDDHLVKPTLLEKQLKMRTDADIEHDLIMNGKNIKIGYDLTENGKDIAVSLDSSIDFNGTDIVKDTEEIQDE